MGDLESQALWKLVRRQHGVVAHGQLVAAGLSAKAIKHRVAKGRLYRVRVGIYAVGRPELTRHGRWMGAVLACGPDAVLSHASAAALLRIEDRESRITISLPSTRDVRPAGLRVRRSDLARCDVGTCNAIPVTSPARTLIDLAAEIPTRRLEAAINAADKHDLIDPEALREEVARRPGVRGVPALRRLLDRHTFVLTDSELERRFLPIAHRAGLPRPETGVWLNRFKVDFFWPGLGLVVETDGQRYHRTAIQQTRDRRREHAHAEAGLYSLRFSHHQVRYEPERVAATLKSVAAQRAGSGLPGAAA